MLDLLYGFIEVLYFFLKQNRIDELESELERRKKQCIERAEEVFSPYMLFSSFDLNDV